MRIFSIFFLAILVTGCSSIYKNQSHIGQTFPSIKGTNLDKEIINIPEEFKGENTLLLMGYKQSSQFDIDRWLIGLDMTQTKVNVYEIPTIKGLFPQMFSVMIDNGMRAGIPKSLWKGVITVYQDGDKIQQFTGNKNPNNARVILLDKDGVILFMYDQGFSVEALNQVRYNLQAP
ncbi:MAG: hypothetical protein ACPG46_05990 [Thalassotalea sp.]